MSGRVTRSQMRRNGASEEGSDSAANRTLDATPEVTPRKTRRSKKASSEDSSSTADEIAGTIVVRLPPSTTPAPPVPAAQPATAPIKKATHQKFGSDDEGEVKVKDVKEASTETKTSNAIVKETTSGNGQDAKEEDEESDDDDAAPEAFSLSTGREQENMRIAEEKKARELQEASVRLKRKALDARLKEQKLQSQPQAKRQKIAPPAISTTTAAPITPSSRQDDSDSAEPSDSNTGITSPASSRTLSLQLPPSEQQFIAPIIYQDRKAKPPLLLPTELLEQVASRPSPPPEDAAAAPVSNSRHKKLADFEAEEKAAQLAAALKKSKITPVYKKGAFRVAVIGKEEEKERERKIMAPPKSKKVSNIKTDWLTKRGVERQPISVGKSAFARR